MSITITIPKVVAERIRKEAKKQEVSLEEYIVNLLLQNLDPQDRAKEYINIAKEFLEQAQREIQKNNIRQAAEKAWRAAALAIQAYAFWKEGKKTS